MKTFKIVFEDYDGNDLFEKTLFDYTVTEAVKYANYFIANYNGSINYKIYEI